MNNHIHLLIKEDKGVSAAISKTNRIHKGEFGEHKRINLSLVRYNIALSIEKDAS
jgi:hypothetical protein